MFAPPLGLLRLLVKLFPLRAHRLFSELSIDELRVRYRKWDYFGVVAFFVLAPLLTYGLHELFIEWSQSLAPRAGDSVYTLLPNSNFWYAPATVLGVIISCFMIYFMYGVLLRSRGQEYRYYANLSTGMNARAMYLTFGLLLGGGFFAIAYFAAHSNLRLTEDEIVFRRIWSLEDEHYPYSRIRRLREVHHSEEDQVDFMIELDDAERWSTKVEVVFPGPREKEFLSQRAGKPIERLVAR